MDEAKEKRKSYRSTVSDMMKDLKKADEGAKTKREVQKDKENKQKEEDNENDVKEQDNNGDSAEKAKKDDESKEESEPANADSDLEKPGSDEKDNTEDEKPDSDEKPESVESNSIESVSVKNADSDDQSSQDSAAVPNKDTTDSDEIVELDENDQAVPKRTSESSPEVVELSDDDEAGKDDSDSEEESSEEEEDQGDPSREPGQDASKSIDDFLLLPFRHGWKRECVMRSVSSTNCDIYYLPPEDTPYRTREAKRKRRSKADQEAYFKDFPHSELTALNFSYAQKPLGLNNAAYELIRKAKNEEVKQVVKASRAKQVKSGVRRSSVNYKEVDESSGLLESSSDESDNESVPGDHFDLEMPITLQVNSKVNGLRSIYQKRRKNYTRDAGTPPLAEDMLWAELDDDPLGIYTELGGRSSPSATPPQLRAMKLTVKETAEKIIEALNKIKEEASKVDMLKEQELSENLASHDSAIKKFKNFKSESRPSSGYSGFRSSPLDHRLKNLSGISFSRKSVQPSQPFRPCTMHCPGVGGMLPNLQCTTCQCLFHSKCQGVSQNNAKNFKCRNCVRRANMQPQSRRPQLISKMRTENNSVSRNFVRVKLPMPAQNGKRPVVELVMHQNGKYQPIKFSNNMQVTETIPRSMFDQANAMRKTLYQKASQVSKVGTRPIFLAINPTNTGITSRIPAGLFGSPTPSVAPPRPANGPLRGSPASAPPADSDQVAILVRPHKGTKQVLLNVPRKIAIKVKTGTTLSFSASSDQKYTVVDNKMRPPVKTAKPTPRPIRPAIPPGVRRLPPLPGVPRLPPLPRGVSIRPITSSGAVRRPLPPPVRGPPPNKMRRVGQPVQQQKRASVLSTGEVVAGPMNSTMNPCTPHCPGVTGFPEIECNGCQTLFHARCAGIPQQAIETIKAKGSYRCMMCSKTKGQLSTGPQVIDLE